MLLTATLPGLLSATVTCPVAVFATLPKSKLPWSVANSPRLPLQVSAKLTLLLLTALELIVKVPGREPFADGLQATIQVTAGSVVSSVSGRLGPVMV